LFRWKTLRRRLLIALGLGLLIFLGLAVWGGIREVWGTFLGFRWEWMPLALGFTALNYALRWWKWHYYLRYLGISDIGWRDSVLLFVAGMTMAVTPGKMGEVFKSYLLKQINGTPISRSAPIVIAERLTDGLGMLLIVSSWPRTAPWPCACSLSANVSAWCAASVPPCAISTKAPTNCWVGNRSCG